MESGRELGRIRVLVNCFFSLSVQSYIWGRRSRIMLDIRLIRITFLGTFIILGACLAVPAQTAREDEQFGPVVRAYLGYLRNEQEVVDDRASRREINAVYYRRNSNRIRALRQMAMRI